MPHDIEKLRAKLPGMLPTERRNLWENARKLGAADVVELIERSGLDFRREGSISQEDPIGRAIHRVVFAPEGKAAMDAAVAAGLPPLGGVDPLLQTALGADYGPHNEATATAGYLVTNYMRQLGHRETGSAKLPSGCVAKSGKLFKPARAARTLA